MDENNNIIVVDKYNNRIELLSLALTHLGYLAISGHQLNQSTALHLDFLNLRLYVGDSYGHFFVLADN